MSTTWIIFTGAMLCNLAIWIALREAGDSSPQFWACVAGGLALAAVGVAGTLGLLAGVSV